LGLFKRRDELRQVVIAGIVAAGMFALAPQSHAVTCANGVYRAGCAGPNGAAVVRKAPVYHAKPRVTCANGVYRAGCVGPRGAAVVRKPY
jgi:hypothetical protein